MASSHDMRAGPPTRILCLRLTMLKVDLSDAHFTHSQRRQGKRKTARDATQELMRHEAHATAITVSDFLKYRKFPLVKLSSASLQRLLAPKLYADSHLHACHVG